MRVSTLRVVGIPGTNKVMAGELSRLARRAFEDKRLERPRKAGTGTLIYPFDPELAALAAGYQRTASRVLWDLYESRASRLEPLYDELTDDVAGDDRQWLVDGLRFSIRARNLGGFAAGQAQVVGAVKNALIDGAARRGLTLSVAPEDPDVLIAVRMHDDIVSVSLDLVGRPMHERGYRTAGGAAPLRENLAAVLLMLSRYDPRRDVLIDPMCGSGTIVIEAALMARGEPLWTGAAAPSYRHVPEVAAARSSMEPLFSDTAVRILGNDIHTQVVASAREHLLAANQAGRVVITHGDVRDLHAHRIDKALGAGASRGPGLILCNPPYGERLEADRELYADLGAWCREHRGWRAAFLVANPEFKSAFGGRPRVQKPLRNGSQRAYFYLYDL